MLKLFLLPIVLVSSNFLKIRGNFKCDQPRFCRSISLFEEDLLFDDSISNFDEKCIESRTNNSFSYDKPQEISGDFSLNYEFYMIIHHTCTKTGLYKTIRHDFNSTAVRSEVFLNFDIDLSEGDSSSSFEEVAIFSNSSIELKEKLLCDQDKFCRRSFLMRENENITEQVYKYADFCAFNKTENIVRKLEKVNVEDDENINYFMEIHHTCNNGEEWKIATKKIEKLSCVSTFEIDLNAPENQKSETKSNQPQ